MLSEIRKQELAELALAVTSTYFFEQERVDLEYIAQQNDITFSYGHYEDAFDGMLEHRSGNFHIYLNLDRLTVKESPRTRFTFAHELGHYYIDEHRNALAGGKAPSHPSFNRLINKNPVEREADYFASCLLMPENSVRTMCFKRPLSSRLLENISVRFNASISATIFKYFELNLFPMCIILSHDGKIVWTQRSRDFWHGQLPKKGYPVPKSTGAGEFFENRIRYDTEQVLYGDDWFQGNGMKKEKEYFEKCYYRDGKTVMSVIWEKETKSPLR